MAVINRHGKTLFYGLFTLITSLIITSDAQCDPTSSGIKHYGKDCTNTCHCINNEQCDATTGYCTSGCDFNWVGPGCQFRNIAFNKESRHNANINPPMYSDRANDNDVTTCSTTVTWTTVVPWWALWWPDYTTFRKIVFVTKENYLPYFPNFKVIVQNVSRFDFIHKVYSTSGEVCYQHDASIPHKTTVQVTCTDVPIGNFIRLQLANTSTQLVICDLRVYKGCESGFFGPNCNERCRITCRPSGQYVCDNIEGKCLNGCVAGWKGTRCENECEPGQWGKECASTCGHCFSATCNKTNGHCPNGCDAGYKHTDLCIEKCSNGYYGKNCTHQCSSTCSSGKDICDHANGTCLNGCKAGWKGLKCESECPTGRWGINCADTCGHCLSGNCRHTDGVCDGGCAAGVKITPHCDKECNDQSFGFNCSGVCSNKCKGVCSKQTGGCKYCNSGWHGEKCTLECDDGRWGESCKRACMTCHTETCNRISGACYSHCKPGYKQTEFCDQECSHGWYGLNCSEECTSNCRNITFCRKTDGSCIECKPGLEGKICDKDTEEQAEKSMHISVGGFAAIVVTFIVLNFFSVFLSIFILRQRQHRYQSQSENETVTYANVLAAEGNSASHNTPASNVDVEMQNTYDTLKRTSGIEHIYE